MSHDLISVIMPCYNAEAYLEEAVASVMGQTYPKVELILIDDGSTDRSIEIAERLTNAQSNRITLFRQANLGPYPARNLGLQYARGEFIAFLDADDWWDSTCLAQLHSALTNSAAMVAYCGWQNVGSSERSNEPFIPKDYETAHKLELLLMGGSPWPIHAALARRSAIQEIGGFRVDLTTSLDFELWIRLAAENTLIRVPQTLAFYRFHGGGQISSQPWRQAINGWLIKKRFLKEHKDLARALPKARIVELVDRTLFLKGMDAYWRGDFTASWHIFRQAMRTLGWKGSDFKYLVLALLPKQTYVKLVRVLCGR